MFAMPATQNDNEKLSVNDFSTMYNKWLKELTDIENHLIKKAEDTQSLQCSLNEDADVLKAVNEKLIPLQIEQNYLDDHLTSLMKEQDELEREVLKLDEIEKSLVECSVEDETEDYPEILENLNTELTNLKEQVKEIVDKINTKTNKFEKNKNPFSIYCTIMDRYTDALQVLENSAADVHQKLDELNDTD